MCICKLGQADKQLANASCISRPRVLKIHQDTRHFPGRETSAVCGPSVGEGQAAPPHSVVGEASDVAGAPWLEFLCGVLIFT
jgi:hypothetical protein